MEGFHCDDDNTSIPPPPASFPGRSHHPCLIACSMQIRRGRAWDIWSCVMTSGRQMADIWAAVPDRNNSTCMSRCVIACDEIYVAFPHLSTYTASYLYKHWGQPVNLYPSTRTHTHTCTQTSGGINTVALKEPRVIGEGSSRGLEYPNAQS